jgi:hypothetical protein
MVQRELAYVSPVALEYGREPAEYAKKIVSLVEETYKNKVEYAKEKQAEREGKEQGFADARSEYKRQLDLVMEGREGQKVDMYLDGRAVLNMIANGYESKEVQNAVKLDSPMLGSLKAEPYKYAYAIVKSAEDVVARQEAIRNFEMPEGYSGGKDVPEEFRGIVVADEYIHRMHEAEKAGQVISGKMDTEVAIGMIKDGFAKGEVQLAIQEFSPIEKDFGRKEGYAVRIAYNAYEQVELEKYRADRFQAPVREDKAATAAEEYQYQMDRFEKANPGVKVTADVEKKIVGTLLKEYGKGEVNQAIQEKSPLGGNLSNERRTYAGKVISGIEKESSLQESKCATR